MNTINNYSSFNSNTNYRKVNKNPNFKAVVVTDAAIPVIQNAIKAINRIPTNKTEVKEYANALKIAKLLDNVYKVAGLPTALHDFVIDFVSGWGKNMDLVLGMKKIDSDISTTVRQTDQVSRIGKSIIIENKNPENTLTLDVESEDVAKELVKKLRYDSQNNPDNTQAFIEFYNKLESKARQDLKKAVKTMHKLVTQ